MSIRNNRGFTMVETLIAAGILVGGMMAVMGIISAQQKLMSGQMQSASVSFIRQNLVNLITTQGAWNKTRELNSEMACMKTYPSTCTNGQTAVINLYGQDGSLVVDSKNSAGGLRQNGTACSSYGPSSKTDCAVRAVVTWEVVCSSPATCQYPQELISVEFTQKNFLEGIFSSLSAFDIKKMARVDMGENQSPLINCVKVGKFFVGFDKSYIDADGKKHDADGSGCVDAAAFKGQKGDPGIAGTRGTASVPAPTPTPTVAPADPPPHVPTMVCMFDSNNFYKFIDSPYLGCGAGGSGGPLGPGRCESGGRGFNCAGAAAVVNGVIVSTSSGNVRRGSLIHRGKTIGCQKGNLGRVDLYEICSLR